MKIVNLIRNFVGALMLVIPVVGACGDTEAVKQWKEFAAKTGNPKHQKWVEEISSKEAVALAREWKEFLGYDAHSLIAKANISAELKPGLKITKDNIVNYPWLKDFLPEATRNRVMDSDWFSWEEVVIVPTNNYYMSRGTLATSKAVKEKNITMSVNDKGELMNSLGNFALLDDQTAGAIPFTKPTTGMELHYSYVQNAIANDNVWLRPMTIDVCNRSNSVERRYEMYIWWQKFHGRGDIEPMGSVPDKEGLIEGGAVFFREPFDVKGLAGVRKRYAAADREDDFAVFVPNLRRTRLLSASDAQDPLAAGLDLTWDDWRGYWQKTAPRKFSYTMMGEGFMLAQPEVGHVYDSRTRDGCNFKSIELELRPVWIYEVIDRTGRYQYSKRTLYIDKENFYLQLMVTYDPRGQLYRMWDDARDFDPQTGLWQWRSVNLWNMVSKRVNFLEMTSQWGDALETEVGGSVFDIDQLRDFQ